MTSPTLITPRLILRPFNLADAPAVQCLAGERSIAETTLLIPHPYEEGIAEKWIETHAATFESGTGVTFAITSKADGILIGAISLMDISAGHQAEIGYWIGVPYWGQGYCTEAARAVVEYVFTTLNLVRVHAHHFTRNPASGKVLRKIGMKYEGCRRRHVHKWGQFEDIEMYGILREEWEP
jgi:[ribosomal protein S5]-alanine N-acetyltransferase